MIGIQYLEQNKGKYVTPTKAVYLTSILLFRYSKLDFNTFNSRFDLYANHLAKFQESKGGQAFSKTVSRHFYYGDIYNL